LPEFGFFVWGFVETNHGEMLLKHFAAFLWVSCFKQKINLNSFAAKIKKKRKKNWSKNFSVNDFVAFKTSSFELRQEEKYFFFKFEPQAFSRDFS